MSAVETSGIPAGDEREGLMWEDPGPPFGRGRVVWHFPELKANPMKWARFPASSQGMARLIERHTSQGFEFCSRDRDGRRVLFGRYNPDLDERRASDSDLKLERDAS